MLLVYLPKITARNRYCIKTVFKTLLKCEEFEISSDLDRFSEHVGPRLSYGKKAISDEVFIYADGLLEKKGIDEQQINFGSHEELITLFAHKGKASLPYDVFSAVFYMLSRYEEYLPHLRDHYDRFTARESLAYQKGFLQKPVVDLWAIQLKEAILKKYPNAAFGKRTYQFLPTIDIDNAYAFKGKGLLRTIGSYFRALIKFNFHEIYEHSLVLLGRKKDPFDTYNYQLNIQKRYFTRPIYFILLADYGLNDKNISFENRNFQSLIKSIDDYAQVGIHPSFGSNSDTAKLKKEINRLEKIVKRDVFRSRQHFLKLSLPETYRNLIEHDIREDYTMGFASEPGFRAGTCTPFPFFDLDEEIECNLMVFPFQVMESTYKYYLNYSIEQSISSIKEMIDQVKKVNGTFISLWHNESLSDAGEWSGWKVVYEELNEYASKK